MNVQILAALRETSLGAILAQLAAAGEGQYHEVIPRFIEMLREKRQHLIPGSEPWEQNLGLEGLLTSLLRFERKGNQVEPVMVVRHLIAA